MVLPPDGEVHEAPTPVFEHHRAYFDALADIYEDEAIAVGWTVNEVVAEELAGLTPPAMVLDLACGTGVTLRLLQRAFPDAELTGVDLSPAMAEVARTQIPEAHVIVDEVTHFAARWPHQFELVTAVGGLEFVPDLPQLLVSMKNLVAPGGHLIVTYEPIVEGSIQQSEARVAIPVGSGVVVTTHRWPPEEVAAGLADWTLINHRTLPAYERDGLQVTYGLLHARRPTWSGQ